MTAFLLGLVAGGVPAWWLTSRHHQALRVDRDLHEQDAHAKGDAADALAAENQLLRDVLRGTT